MTEFLKNVQNPEILRLPIEDIIDTSGYSHAQFLRLFKQISNQTFINYVTQLRISHAKLLLSNSPNYSIEDVAIKVGYENTSYFVQCFKKYTGYTPKNYQKLMLKKE